MTSKLQRLTYEVSGSVQGVFFRKYTIKQGKLLGLVGYVKNTSHNTVAGVAEGEYSKLRQFNEWLYTGSPQSKVSHVKAEYSDVDKLSYTDFIQQ